MATTPQTFANHTRWHAPFHFFVIPVMLINVIWAIVIFVKGPNWNTGWWIIVSLALVVLVVAGMLVQSFRRLATTPLGFDTSNLLTLRLELPVANYGDDAARARFGRQLEEKLQSLPGVKSATLQEMPRASK